MSSTVRPPYSTLAEIAARIKSGEMTRTTAAKAYGLDRVYLSTWLSRAGLAKDLPSQRGKVGFAAELVAKAQENPDNVAATERAIEMVLRGEASAMEAARQCPGASHRTVAAKVRKARLARGEPVQARRGKQTAG